MFEKRYSDARPLVVQSKKDKRWAVGSGFAALISLINGQWIIAFICIALCVCYIFMYNKHIRREAEAEEFIKKFTDEEDNGNSRFEDLMALKQKQNTHKSRKERKNEYKDYLKQVDEEFDLSGLDDEEYEENESDDGYSF